MNSIIDVISKNLGMFSGNIPFRTLMCSSAGDNTPPVRKSPLKVSHDTGATLKITNS